MVSASLGVKEELMATLKHCSDRSGTGANTCCVTTICVLKCSVQKGKALTNSESMPVMASETLLLAWVHSTW
jgi:hypothetical protein